MKKEKNENKKNYFAWFTVFYNELLDLAIIFRKSDNQKRIKIVGDLLFLVVITCLLKIPFIFVRNLGDDLINVLFNNNINFLAIWGLLIELVYVILALKFFMKTFNKWMNKVD